MSHAAVFLITFSGLLFEVSLTRIYSATIWYHFTFIAVSVALLGWGLGGFALHAGKTRGRLAPSLELAASCTLGYAISIPLCLWLVTRFAFTVWLLPLYFTAPLIPFFLAGMALSAIFDVRRATTGSLYFADLVGAALGALAVTMLLQRLGGEATVLAAAVAPFAAVAFLSSGTSRRVAGLAGAALVLLAAVTNASTGLLRAVPGESKAMRRHMDELAGARLALTGWNAYSRIDAVEGFAPPYLARLYIDSDAWTSVLEWDGDLDRVSDMREWYRALPFTLFNRPETLIIGPGGGSDVLVALASGSRRVTAVELNPLMVEFVRHYGARAGNLYARPDVEIIQSEGRNFISRTDRRFDVIFLGFVDSWASVASGGLSLSENYLYTTEAFSGYYDRLTDDGVLVILRWDADVPRLVANSIALLGVEEAAKRIVVVMERREGTRDDPPQMIFMLRKRPFTAQETAAIASTWTVARPVIVPGRHVDPPYGDLFSGKLTMEEHIARAPARVGPVFDDSPFYFATHRPVGIAPGMALALLALVVPVAGLLVWFVTAGRPQAEPRPAYSPAIVYFAALGAGFITVELALLQHLTLLLGHPIFTLSLLLFTLLAAGGLGSAISARVPARLACIVVGLLSLAYAVILPAIVPQLLPLELSARIAVAVAVIVPLGIAMGIPFPRGLRRAGRNGLPAPPFFWGLNGVMSVLGSVATVLIALTLGFSAAMIAGAICYAVAAVVAWVVDGRVAEVL